MGNSKIQLADGTVLLDISLDTVAAGNMLQGITAHGSSGEAITGSIPSQSATSITPGDVAQTAILAGTYASGNVTVLPVPNTYAKLATLFPIGALWATKSSTTEPSQVLGIGTWRKVAPLSATWGDLKNVTWDSLHAVPTGVYVWERIA